MPAPVSVERGQSKERLIAIQAPELAGTLEVRPGVAFRPTLGFDPQPSG
jgi:hypothetical protein